MTLYARVDNGGMVAELFDTNQDINELFNPALIWANADNVVGIAVGWSAKNQQGTWVFAPPTTESFPQLLAQAQTAQIQTLNAAYQAAIVVPVSYTSKGGVTKTYQADSASVANLSQMLLAFGASQAVPAGFYWVSLDNTQVPFTYADMQGLAAAFGTQGAAAFQQLQSLKAQVNAATTVSAVQAVAWP